MNLADKALRLAMRGIPVFPCNHDKRPATRNGFQDATTDPELVELWRWDDDRLIGVPTGSPSCILVLDIDPRHGGDRFLTANRARLNTRMHATRGGGTHLLFRDNGAVRNSAGRIYSGVDVRGEGGYIIWWPAHGCPVLNSVPLRQLPEWPDWLIVEPDEPVQRLRINGQRIVLADRHQVNVLVNFVRQSRQGERNNRLFWAACRLSELRFTRSESYYAAIDKLLRAACSTGLDYEEAQRTIESGLNA
jgi:hypothetical protein